MYDAYNAGHEIDFTTRNGYRGSLSSLHNLELTKTRVLAYLRQFGFDNVRSFVVYDNSATVEQFRVDTV